MLNANILSLKGQLSMAGIDDFYKYAVPKRTKCSSGFSKCNCLLPQIVLESCSLLNLINLLGLSNRGWRLDIVAFRQAIKKRKRIDSLTYPFPKPN